MPAVADFLLQVGWRRDQIDGALDLTGARSCLQNLQDRGVHVSATSVHFGSDPVASLDIHAVPWNQSRKTYGAILDALQA